MGGLVIKKSGVYIITCKSNDKHYIGYSVNITKRLNSHKSMLRTKKHPNQHLQAAYNLYGAENFSFEILEQYPDEFMASMENWWCNLLNTHDNRFGFNLKNTGERVHKHNESTKKKLSELKMGKPLPTKGRKLSPERVEQNRLCHIGIKHTKESKEKMSIVQSEFRYAILKPDGTYVQVTSLQKFAKENKVSYSALLYTIKGYNEKGQTVTQIKGYSVLVKKKIGEEITKEEIENRISELKRVKEAKSPYAHFNYKILTPTGKVEETNSIHKYAKERKLSESALACTFIGYNHKGNTTSQHKGYKIIAKEPIDKQKQVA